jgi:hypothetical protein
MVALVGNRSCGAIVVSCSMRGAKKIVQLVVAWMCDCVCRDKRAVSLEMTMSVWLNEKNSRLVCWLCLVAVWLGEWFIAVVLMVMSLVRCKGLVLTLVLWTFHHRITMDGGTSWDSSCGVMVVSCGMRGTKKIVQSVVAWVCDCVCKGEWAVSLGMARQFWCDLMRKIVFE